MIEDQLLKTFGRRVEEEVRDAVEQGNYPAHVQYHAALTQVFLDYLREGNLIPETELAPHEDVTGRNRCRLMAWSLPDDSSRLELYTASFVSSDEGTTLTQGDIEQLGHRAMRFVSYALKRDLERFSESPEAYEAATAVGDGRGRIDEVRVNILTNASVRDRRATRGTTIEGLPVSFSVWDAERLHRITAEEFSRDVIDIDFTKLTGRPMPCLEMKPPASEYQTFLLILSGRLLADLYQEYRARLFELNVRSFLQAKGSVNKGIRATIDTEPSRFLAYNNGLTATADEIEVGQWHGETVIHRIRGLQIVNGAQTTASIHRAAYDKQNIADISAVAVSMKLTRVLPDKLKEFVPKIAEFANTQNPVQVADLSANTDFQVEMERLSGRIWCPGEEERWFYERGRGAFAVARARFNPKSAALRDFDEEHPKNKRFGKTDLSRYYMSWFGFPHHVSRGTQKNFVEFQRHLRERRGEAWKPDEDFYRAAIATAIITKTVQDVVRRATRAKTIESYGANVVTYLVAKLGHDYPDLNLGDVWEAQELSDGLRHLIESWVPVIHAEIVRAAGRTNVTEFAKKEACWAAIRELEVPEPAELPPELGGEVDEEPEEAKVVEPAQQAAGATPRSEVRAEQSSSLSPAPTHGVDKDETEEGAANIALCCSLDARRWTDIMSWCANSSRVTPFDRKLANYVCGLSLDRWQKKPTAKQARYAAKVINAAREAGVV